MPISATIARLWKTLILRHKRFGPRNPGAETHSHLALLLPASVFVQMQRNNS